MLARRVPLRRSAPLRRSVAPERYVPVRKKRSRPRLGPQRSPDYLAWIRTLPCVVCGSARLVEAAHTNALGPRGLGQKASDFSAVPLCAAHHRTGVDSYHRLGEEHFGRVHQVDLSETVFVLNHEFNNLPGCPKACE